MQQHYFLGIAMPSTIEKTVKEYRHQLQLDKQYKVLPSIQDMHITLLYIGSLHETLMASLQTKLTTIGTKTTSFTMKMNHLDSFGNDNGPRVIYLGFEDCDALQQLQQQVATSCNDFFPVHQRPVFIPHCTIAKKRKTTESLHLSKQFFEPIDISITSFSLFAIHPQRVPKYEAVFTVPLT